MTHTGPNNPGNGANENADKKNRDIEWGIHELLEKGMSSFLGKNKEWIDPIIFDRIKNQKTGIISGARDVINGVHFSERKKFWEITNEMIRDKITDKLILNEFINQTQELRAARDKIIFRSKRDFPNIETNIPGFSGSINNKINTLRNGELGDALENINRLKKFIARIYNVDVDTIDEEKLDLPAIFHDLPEDSDLKRRLVYQYNHQSSGWSTVDVFLLKEIFSYYKDKPVRKREIAEFLDIELTLKEIESLGLWTETEFLNYAEKQFSDAWNDLSDEEKKQIVAAMKYEDIFKVSIKNLPQNISWNIDLYNYLDRGFWDKLQYLMLEKAKWDKIMGDIIPEQNTDPTSTDLLLQNPVIDKVNKLRKGGNKKNIEWIDALRNIGSVLVFKDPNDPTKTIMMEILEINKDLWAGDHGIAYKILSLKDGRLSRSATSQNLSYSDFWHLLYGLWENARALSEDEFQERITEDENLKDYNNWNLLDNPNIQFLEATQENLEGTVDWLKKELDQIDPEGASYGYADGVNFLSTAQDKKWVTFESSFSILSLTEGGITIWNWKENQTFWLVDFLAAVREFGFKRNSKITSDTDVVKAFQVFWVDGDAHLKHGQLMIAKKDLDHHDDHHEWESHGNNNHDEKEVSYEFFKSEVDGSHIRIYNIDQNFVTFGEYSSDKSLEDVQKYNTKKWLNEKQKKWLYTNQTFPLAYFLKYLKENKLKATTENLLVEDTYKEQKPHMHGSLMKSWMNSWSINDIIHGMKWITHGIEHYLEKWSKLNASRAALRMGRMIWLPADVIAQLQADEVGNIREIVDKIKTKLKDQNGPVARLKVMHIIHNSSSRPEEVAAATMYMVESYGHLYAEDILTGQWWEHFLNALIYACWYRTDAQREEQKAKARKKFKGDIGTEPWQQITEEEMIWGFMKGIDGGAEKNPMAGTLIKAMWWPAGWEKAFRKEGFEGAREKWVRQTNDLANAQGRLNKFKSALATQEYVTAFGMMGTIPAKNPSPALQSAPIMWALLGTTGYASSPLPQQIFMLAAAKGHSFHAYSFLRNKEQNDLYKDTFFEALDGLADKWEIVSLKWAISDMQLHGHFIEGDTNDKSNKKRLKAINTIESIWTKYHDKGLHARLQWTDQKWFLEQMQEKKNGQVQKYFNHISGIHTESTMGWLDINWEDANSWKNQYGYTGSPILKVTNEGFSSLAFMLNKLKVNGSTNYSLNNDYEDRFWKPSLAIIKSLQRDSSIPEELKRKQFDQYRRDIIEQMREFFNARTRASSGQKDIDDAVDKIRSNQYGRDIESLGIDLTQIFKTEYTPSSESDYQGFNSWWISGQRSATHTDQVQKEHNSTIARVIAETKNEAANDTTYDQRQAA